LRAVLSSFVVLFLFSGIVLAQSPEREAAADPQGSPVKIALNVPQGTPLPVVLAKDIRIREVGQPIQGKIAEPIYVFDKLVIPQGSEISGRVTRIAGIPTFRRVVSAANSNFSPSHQVEVTFDTLDLPGGRQIPLRTRVSPASQGVLRFTSAPSSGNERKKPDDLVSFVSATVGHARQAIGREWGGVKSQTSQGKLHWLKRLAIAEMPVHPQYFDAGTRFNAELLDALNFGTEELPPASLKMVGTPPADGSIVHALLQTPLDSASAQPGEAIEAVITEPLITEGQLVLPVGTVLKGSVLQAQPARRLHRNGQLRIVFRQVVPPGAAEQHVEASLEGVEVKSDQNLSLDSEGGAQANAPSTRYLTTGISLALAAFSILPDADAGQPGQSALELITRGADGASGFGVIGFATGALVHSRPVATGFGVYGASMSVYANFLSRGHDVVYPKDTAMAIGFGARVTKPAKSGASSSNAPAGASLAASK